MFSILFNTVGVNLRCATNRSRHSPLCSKGSKCRPPPPFSLTILIETPSSQNTVIVSMARKCDQRERLCHETEGCHVNRVKEMCYHFHVMAEVSQVLLSFVLVVDRFLAHIVQRKTD